MLISLRKNLALLSMPKTGTTALEAVLAPHCDIVYGGEPRVKHMPLRRFERFLRPYLRDMSATPVETACLFRAPEDWLGSWYRYRAREQLTGHPNSTRAISFDAFVRAYLSDDKPPFARVGRPYRFVTNSDNQVGIDHLFRYENFDAYLRFVEERFAMPLALERLNVSPVLELELEPATRRALRAALADDYRVHEQIAI